MSTDLLAIVVVAGVVVMAIMVVVVIVAQFHEYPYVYRNMWNTFAKQFAHT